VKPSKISLQKDSSVALVSDERYALIHNISLREVTARQEARLLEMSQRFLSTALLTSDSPSATKVGGGED
jgi:hypothetical protein